MTASTGLPWELRIVTYDDTPERSHVLPINDLKPHELTLLVRGDEVKTACWCNALIDDDGLVIHNSVDRREEIERAEAQVQ